LFKGVTATRQMTAEAIAVSGGAASVPRQHIPTNAAMPIMSATTVAAITRIHHLFLAFILIVFVVTKVLLGHRFDLRWQAVPATAAAVVGTVGRLTQCFYKWMVATHDMLACQPIKCLA